MTAPRPLRPDDCALRVHDLGFAFMTALRADDRVAFA
jgi:hypothetical protein